MYNIIQYNIKQYIIYYFICNNLISLYLHMSIKATLMLLNPLKPSDYAAQFLT